MKPGPPPLAAMRPNAARLSPCRREATNLPRLSTTQGAGRACAKAHVRPEGPVGAWRASHAMLWFFGSPPVEPRRVNLPREAIRHFVTPQGRSVLCSRGRFGPLGLHALFSVLQGAKAPFPCRGEGQRPTPSNQPSSQSPLCSLWPFVCFVVKTHRQSSCTFVVLRVLRDHLKTRHFSPAASPVARLSGVLFSVLCGRGRFGPPGLHALFSVLQGGNAAPTAPTRGD